MDEVKIIENAVTALASLLDAQGHEGWCPIQGCECSGCRGERAHEALNNLLMNK